VGNRINQPTNSYVGVNKYVNSDINDLVSMSYSFNYGMRKNLGASGKALKGGRVYTA